MQTLLPGDDALRGMGSLVAQTASTIYGATAYSVHASRDRGKTWRKVFSLKQTSTKSLLPHCSLGRNSETASKAVISSNPAYSDDGSYCLVCEDGTTRNATDGTCSAAVAASAAAARGVTSLLVPSAAGLLTMPTQPVGIYHGDMCLRYNFGRFP